MLSRTTIIKYPMGFEISYLTHRY